jgi:hypothetical protein
MKGNTTVRAPDRRLAERSTGTQHANQWNRSRIRMIESIALTVWWVLSVPAHGQTVVPKAVLDRISSVATLTALDGTGKPLRTGSGFPISDRVLVTNFHVVQHATSVLATFPDGHRVALDALVAADESNDIVKLGQMGASTSIWPRLEGFLVSVTTPQVGSRVYVVGSPRGLGGTVSEGIVSGLRGRDELAGERLQLSAPISPGSSGSPVLDPDGRVVGVISSTLEDSQLLNFAIPASAVAELRESSGELLRDHKWPDSKAAPDAGADIRSVKESIYKRIVDGCGRFEQLPKDMDAVLRALEPDQYGASDVSAHALANTFKAAVIEQASRVLRSDSIPIYDMVDRYGWFDQNHHHELSLLLVFGVGLSLSECETIKASVLQTVRLHRANAEAWKLLDEVNGWLIHDGRTSFRCPFEIARLLKDDPQARLRYHERCGEAPAIWVVKTIHGVDDGDHANEPDERTLDSLLAHEFLSIADPDLSLPILSKIEEKDSRWTKAPVYLYVKSCLLRRSVERKARLAMGVADDLSEQALLLDGYMSKGLHPFRGYQSDVSAEAIDALKPFKASIDAALALCEQSFELKMAQSKATLLRQQKSGEAYVPTNECIDCARLAFYSGDCDKSIRYAKMLCVATEKRLDHPSDTGERSPKWLSEFLQDTTTMVNGELDLARTCVRCASANGAQSSFDRAKEVRALRLKSLREEDRLSPAFHDWTEALDLTFRRTESAISSMPR